MRLLTKRGANLVGGVEELVEGLCEFVVGVVLCDEVLPHFGQLGLEALDHDAHQLALLRGALAAGGLQGLREDPWRETKGQLQLLVSV